MTGFARSGDGTRIAYDRLGSGPHVLIVGGLLCDRTYTHPLAAALAAQFKVTNYDRRGRGQSGNTAPYAVAREVDDIAALIADAGGTAMVYGHSSGAALALNAAASHLPITRLVLHEPPYGADDEDSRNRSKTLARDIQAMIAAGDRERAIRRFFDDTGMPEEVINGIATDTKMLAMAPTMVHDLEVMGDFDRGGTIPEHLVREVAVPTLLIHGDRSPEFFRDTANRIAKLLPDARHAVLEGQDHEAPAKVVAPVVAAFLSRARAA